MMTTSNEHNNAPAVPQDMRLVPVWLLERVEQSLGSFTSDEGWSQSDMDTMDSVSALLAAAPAPAPAQEPFGYFRAEPFGWTDCSEDAEGAIALYEHPAAPAQEPAGEAVAAALGDIIAMWDQHVPSEYVTPLHMQAKRALEGQQPVSPDMHGWCAYVGGMVAHWIRSEPDAFIQIGEERFEAAIAGIIERRLWAMPKDNKPTAAPKPAQEVGLTDRQFDLICQAIDKADTVTMDGDYMLDSDDCIGVVRVMQVLFDIAALRAKGAV